MPGDGLPTRKREWSGQECGTLGHVTSVSPESTISRPRATLDRRILLGNLASGALWLAPVAVNAWPIALFGATYVVVASVFLARVLTYKPRSLREDVLIWAVPWVAAMLLWVGIIAPIGPNDGAADVVGGVFAGCVVGTLCFLGWQLLAFPIRQLLAWLEI